MQQLDSFTILATAFGTARKFSFDSLNGLTIHGLTKSEAGLIATVLEGLDQEAVVAIAQGKKLAPVEENKAQWAPTPPEHTPPVEVSQPEDLKPETPEEKTTVIKETVQKIDLQSVGEINEAIREGNAAGEKRKDPDPVSGEIETPPHKPSHEELTGTDTQPEPAPKRSRTKKQGKKRGKKKAPPKPSELPVKLPEPGAEFEDSRIVSVVDHSDGGRLLVLENGWRIKVDVKGVEQARIEGEPPKSQEAYSSSDQAGKTEDESSIVVPVEIMQSRMTRDILTCLIDQGVTDQEKLVEECERLRTNGATAFMASKDIHSVRRRVMSTLTVMGRA